jgi:hypothetical protein
MITDFDDYPLHQAPEPVARPATTDRNFYDRYWFNGFEREGGFYFGAGLGVYPNRSVMDAHFSVLVDGVQHSFHASRRAPSERSELTVGPLTIEILEPMRQLRVRLEPNDTGIECDLTFRARTAPYEEPRSVLRDGERVILDTVRFLQFGTWSGSIQAGEACVDVVNDRVLGVRDRSWGIRPVGEREQGAPPTSEPGIFWVWSVNHFDDICTFYETFEDHDGGTILAHAAILPTYGSLEAIPHGADPGVVFVKDAGISIDWRSGTRWAKRADLRLAPAGSEPILHSLEPNLCFHLKGIGYQHPEWGHGVWKGEDVHAGEHWRVDELDPLSFPNLHVQQVCRVVAGNRRGAGALEQLVIGSHKPSGLGFLDGAK